jgi:hypothetical protein
MIWTLWAFLLITHGALTQWVKAAPHLLASTVGDVALITVGLITIDQFQGLSVPEILRIGAFFVAFGYSGRQLANCLLPRRVRR